MRINKDQLFKILMRRKIFLGFVDIAGQIGDFSKEYKRQGFNVFSVVHIRNVLFNSNEYSFVLRNIYPPFLIKKNDFVLLRKIYTLLIYIPFYHLFMLWAVFSFDVFHFIWYTEKSNKFYLFLIKRLKKKIIVSFVGSEIRWIPLWIKEFEQRNLDHVVMTNEVERTTSQKEYFESRIRYVRVFEKYADIILSYPEQAQLQIRPYHNFYIPIDLTKTKTIKEQKKTPLVSIGIRDSFLKGGDMVHRLVNDYKESNDSVDFELTILAGMDHNEVLEILKQTDIFIYSPYGNGAGKFGHEAVACGAVTLVSFDGNWIKLPPQAPFVNVQENNLIDRLDYYLRNAEERRKLSQSGMEWANKWTDIKWIVTDILNKLDNKREPDYYPDFFRDNIPFVYYYNNGICLKICKKWEKYIENCDWYK